MPAQIYEVIALGARYWFLFLMMMIAWRSYRWLARDGKQRRKRLGLLPDAGFIGEMVLQQGGEPLAAGSLLPVPREGVLGSARRCDLVLVSEGIAKRHLWLRYEDDKGLRVKNFGKRPMEIDGVRYEKRNSQAYMQHGSRLIVGKTVLRLRMFAGFEAEAIRGEAVYAHRPEEAGAQASMTAEQMVQWQQYWMLAQQALIQQMQQSASQGEGQEACEPSTVAEEVETGEGHDPLFSPFQPLEEDGLLEALPEEWLETGPEAAESFPGAVDGAVMEVGTDAIFFPPTLEDDPEEEPWPYAPYPHSMAQLESMGYAYPDEREGEELLEDEDMTDAATPPKSLYLEEDEAERAKQLLWDRYLKGRRKP